MLQEELEFTLTYLTYPTHHRRKIRTTNLIEGVINRDLKQRSKTERKGTHSVEKYWIQAKINSL